MTSSGTPCAFNFANSFATAGSHSIIAVFTPADPSVIAGSSSTPPDTFSQTVDPNGPCAAANGGHCTDVQNIDATIPVGTLSITTPYTGSNVLHLGQLALDTNDTEFTGHAAFTGINVTDTRSGALPWTVNVLGSQLTDGGTNPGSAINPENLGLTAINVDPVANNGFVTSSSNLTTFANQPAYPPVSPTDHGSLGLGGATPHEVAHAIVGSGSVGVERVSTRDFRCSL